MINSFRKVQLLIVSILVIVSTFYIGYYLGIRSFSVEIKRNPPLVNIENKYPAKENVDFALFWEVWDIVHTEYLHRPVDKQKMVYGAIEGMLNSLEDPYSAFLQPELNKEIKDNLNGSYQGIGAELTLKDNQLTVVSPLDGSPAKSVGMKPGDKILAINEESTYGLSVQEAVLKIRGEAGTDVKLKLQTSNLDPRDVTITRGVITISSVSWEDKGNGTAYIRLSRFGGDTNADWYKAVSEINNQMRELDSIILDVRGNPGGYLTSAIYIASEFYEDGIVIYTESDLGEQEALRVDDRRGEFTKVPMVIVLIDEGSASASEIIAAALKQNINATLIGKKSFGKGTIQTDIEFDDGSGVHLTIAKWLTPNKSWVHENGINPDFEVEITEDDIINGYDSQLEAALEIAEGY